MFVAAQRYHTVASFTEFQRNIAKFIAARSHHSTGAESDQSVGRRFFYICDIVGAIFHFEPVAVGVWPMRGRHESVGL